MFTPPTTSPSGYGTSIYDWARCGVWHGSRQDWHSSRGGDTLQSKEECDVCHHDPCICRTVDDFMKTPPTLETPRSLTREEFNQLPEWAEFYLQLNNPQVIICDYISCLDVTEGLFGVKWEGEFCSSSFSYYIQDALNWGRLYRITHEH